MWIAISIFCQTGDRTDMLSIFRAYGFILWTYVLILTQINWIRRDRPHPTDCEPPLFCFTYSIVYIFPVSLSLMQINTAGQTSPNCLRPSPPQKENSRTVKLRIHIWRHHLIYLLFGGHVQHKGCRQECCQLPGQSFELWAGSCWHVCT